MNQSGSSGDTVVALLEGSADGFCALDRDGRFVYLNRAAEQILGASRDQLIGRGAFETFGDNAAHFSHAIRDHCGVDFRLKSAALNQWFDVRGCPSADGLAVHFRLAAAGRAPDGTLNDASADVLSAIGDAAPDFVWVTNGDGDLMYVNRRWIEYTGLSPEQTDGRGYVRTIHPADLPRFLNQVEYAQREGTPIEGEFRYRRHDGHYRWFWVRSTPIKDADGNLIRRVGVAVDITDRRDAEHALRESELRFRTMADSAPVLIWMSGPEKAGVYFNRKWLEFTGRSLEQEIGSGWLESIHPDDMPALDSCVEAFAARRPFTTQFRLRRHDGQYRWVLDTGVPRFTETGNFAGFIGSCLDITDRIETERALRESEQRYRGIFDQAAVGMCEASVGGKFTAVNQCFCDMLGYTRAELLELTPLDVTHPEDLPASRVKTDALLAGETDSFTMEKRYRCKDGAEVWAQTSVSAVRDDHGRVTRLVAAVQDVTVQKRLEVERQRSEQLTQHIVEHSPIGILLADTSGRFMHVNDAWLNMLGYTLADVREGRVNWKEMTVPEHRHLDERALELVRTQGSHPPFEKTLLRKDGSRIPVLAATAYLGGPGETGVGFLVDLTDVKRAQQQVQHSEERLQAIIDSVAAVVYIKDVDGRYLLINRHFQETLGIDAATMIGRTDHDFFDRDVADALRANDFEVLRTEQATQFEEVALHPDGPHTYISVKFPLRDASGAVYAVCGVSTDINERKKAEEALRRSEGKYRTLTDAVGSLMWMSDASGQLCFFNRRFDEYLAGNAQQILGLGWQKIVHPDDLGAILRERTAGLAEGREYSVEYRLRRHDGLYRWHLTRIVPHKDADGNILNWFGTATDIHDLKTAEDAVLQAKAEAEQANKAKDQFLAVLSHELRTPLTPVVMTVAAIEMDRTISPQLREDLAMIRRNIELETKLIDDLLDVTRITNGKLRLQPRATDVHALLRNVLEILKSDIGERQLHVTTSLAAGDAAVFADPARLQQVFWNLIKNAIKFTPPHGNITVRSWNASERVVCVEVVDDGAGIEPSVLPRIFNAFDQGEQTITRQFGGLGLGLAISKALTELHGGTIRAESEGKGRGARFTIELPTRTPVERIVDQIQPLGPGADGKPKPRVLLVEDHLDTQRTLRRLLEERGYDVVTAGSVAAALAALAQSSPPIEVIVSDIGLPDATGHELMRTVRATHPIPGIAVSGFGMDSDLKSSLDAGFATHMTKPVDIQQLDGMIRSLLPRREQVQRAVDETEATTPGAAHGR